MTRNSESLSAYSPFTIICGNAKLHYAGYASNDLFALGIFEVMKSALAVGSACPPGSGYRCSAGHVRSGGVCSHDHSGISSSDAFTPGPARGR